jgi:Amt family ammonium transporter
LMALGAGLLWFGWFGFNAGSEVGVDWVTVSSFVNTQLGAAFGKRCSGITFRRMS